MFDTNLDEYSLNYIEYYNEVDNLNFKISLQKIL